MEKLSIPPEFSNYAEEKGIFTLYEGMLHALLVARPEDPLQFLSQYLSVDREKSKRLRYVHPMRCHAKYIPHYHVYSLPH